MSDYLIFETEEFRKKLSKLPTRDAEFIKAKLQKRLYPHLRKSPYWGPNIKKLQGYKPPTWRYRIGRFRIFYLVDEQEHIVFILTIDARKDAYR